MDAVSYYLKVNIAFAVLYGVYLLVWRRETWFNARRAWLLVAPLIAFSLPVIQNGGGNGAAVLLELPRIPASFEKVQDTGPSLPDWLVLLHLLISAVLLVRLVVRIVLTLRSLRSEADHARSFLGRVQVPSSFGGDDRSAIIAHEQVHARERHSLDVIVYELLTAVCWSNPLWRMARREVRLVHELTADRHARGFHPDYVTLLMAQALNVPRRTLMDTFSTSTLKQRLIMLHNNRSPRLSRPKLLFAIPALLIALGLVSWRIAPGTRSLTDATVFSSVDGPAEFPGGMDALIMYISSNIRYPEKAVADNAEGTVHVGFTVKATGAVSSASVKRGVRADLDAEALRVVSGLPKWNPGIAKGKVVDTELILPISFALPKK